jgi:aspartate 1-decarboxylase
LGIDGLAESPFLSPFCGPHPAAMHLQLVKSKIHRAEVTDASLHYAGSLAIDEALMSAAGMLPYEKILVGNIANGHRFETYAIPAPAGSKTISLNGATAHLGKVGDLVTIMSFGWLSAEEAANHRPKVIVLGEGNAKIVTQGSK